MDKTVVISVALVATTVLLLGCISVGALPPEPKEFDFTYTFGVMERNKIDTKNKIFIKDMVQDPSIEYVFGFTPQEKQAIYATLLENDFASMTNDFSTKCFSGVVSYQCGEVTPEWGATLTVTADGFTKTVSWRARYDNSNDAELQRFQNIQNKINEIVSQKEKGMNIKQPAGGYI